MRSREEIEAWVKSKQSPATEIESLRLQVVTIELLLDIRDQQQGIIEAIYEVDKSADRIASNTR